MLCLACRRLDGGSLCPGCRAALRPAPPRRLSTGMLVWSAFEHAGPARALVHRLKYEAIIAAADLLAGAMERAVPAGAACLVPVPRMRARRWRYGVDPAFELARRVGRRLGLPVTMALRPGWMGRVHAGRSRSERAAPILHARRSVPAGSVLIDDVITTGVTLVAAHRALGPVPVAAVTATSATGTSLTARL